MKPALTADFVPDKASASARPGGASLDVLRFLAAGFILVFHYGSTSPVPLGEIFPVLKQGWLATDFFLLLSGFVLSRSYGGRLTSGGMRRTQFFLRRFLRLWPSHLIVLLAFGVFVLTCEVVGLPPTHMDHYGAGAFVAQAFLVHGWGVIAGPVWNVPTWTLSALLVCYALYSVYAPFVQRMSRWGLAAIAVAVVITAEILARSVAHEPLADLSFAWGVLRAVPLFVLGNIVERVTRNVRIAPGQFWTGLAACVLAIVGLEQFPRHALSDAIVLAALATLIAVAGAVSFTETPATRRMGRASFSLFLTHSLVGAIWFGLTAKLAGQYALAPLVQWAMWGLGFAAAVLAAFLFEALIDRPLSARVARLSFVRGA